MDFDEFAMWIMNSEFRPLDDSIDPVQVKADADASVKEGLRKKLVRCIEEHKSIFASFKRSISFQEWISAVGRASMPVTEREARAIFMLFDTADSGFVAPKHMINWAQTADLKPPPPSRDPKKETKKSTIQEALFKVAGKDLIAVKESFAHLPQNGGVRVRFEEFRRCLLANGLGKNVVDTRSLFVACGGDNGSADVDELRKHLHVNVDNSTVLTKKIMPQYVKSSHADRRVREALRKSYLELRENVVALDRAGTGYISADILHKQLLRLSVQISHQDFRYIIQHVEKKENDSMVNYMHFFECFNPQSAPHQLSGVAGGIKAVESLEAAMNKSATARAMANEKKKKESHAEEEARLAKKLSINESMRKVDPSGELRRIWQKVLRECHKSDPERTGCVSRVYFIRALDGANLSNSMTPSAMSSLADRYDAGYGLVNYLACFRTYLTSMTPTDEQRGINSQDSPAMPKAADFKPLHPWDFEYERKKHSEPYWSNTGKIRDPNNSAGPEIDPNTALQKSAKAVTRQEREALLAQYSEKVISGCDKVFQKVAKEMGQWTTLRNEMKNGQVNSQPGTLLTTKFYDIMKKWGVKLTINEMGAMVKSFRGLGMQDVIKYNDFLRVCLLCHSP
jgi:Ca2+-binding EF-hand superfamily protein